MDFILSSYVTVQGPGWGTVACGGVGDPHRSDTEQVPGAACAECSAAHTPWKLDKHRQLAVTEKPAGSSCLVVAPTVAEGSFSINILSVS